MSEALDNLVKLTNGLRLRWEVKAQIEDLAHEIEREIRSQIVHDPRTYQQKKATVAKNAISILLRISHITVRLFSNGKANFSNLSLVGIID